MKISPWRLQMFDECRLKFKFTVVDELSDVYTSPRPYLTMGAHVHNALKDVYDLSGTERNANVLEDLLRKRWKENRTGFADIEEEKKYGMKAVKMLRLFAHKNDLELEPLNTEEFQKVEITPNVFLTGRTDRIDEEEDGLHIIDYKTGRYNEDWVSPMQLKLYAVMVQGSKPKPVTKASFLYLLSNTWYTIDIDQEVIQETVEELLEKVEEIKSEKEYEPTVGSHCKFCDFQDICTVKDQVKEILNG